MADANKKPQPLFAPAARAICPICQKVSYSHAGVHPQCAMLAADVSLHADGGGKRPAFWRPIFGLDDVMKVHQALADRFRKHGSKLVRAAFVNGLPGIITQEADGELQTTALEIEDGRIAAIYVVRNPDKLRHLH